MLDERGSALLEKINGICCGSGFKIFEEEDLLSSFSGGLQQEELKSLLCDLEEKRYIEIRYAEDGVYCLRPLPEGKLYFEALRRQRREGVRRRTDAFFLSALGGFLGSLAGAFLVWLIFFLAGGV